MKSLRAFAVLLLASALCPAAFAQITADLSGRVLDVSGASISGAHIDLTAAATGIHQQVISSATGDYLFTNLNPGAYSLDVTAAGFQHLQRTGITVILGQTVNVDLALAAGGDRQTITVNGDAPLLQAETSNIETNIPGTTELAMPLNSRNFIQLSTLAPGVELPPGTLLPRINGGRPRTNEYLYDGISALQPEPGQVAFFPILDDIEEFTIEADNVPAEFGRFNGGVVNVATRSGANALHGSLYEFFRNEDLNARNYFSPATAANPRRPEYRRNLYGATLGAPILHDHLFFFGDYQGVRQLIGRPITSTIPTMAERQGIFTGVSHIYNPGTTTVVGGVNVRQEFANDVINTPFDPAAIALLARFPTPIHRVGGQQLHPDRQRCRPPEPVRCARRRRLGTHDRSFGRYSYFSDVEQPITALPDGSGPAVAGIIGSGNVAGLSHVLGQQAVFNETHTFTRSLLNDFRLGYTRRGNTIGGPTLSTTASSALGIPGIPTNAAFNNALPLFTFTGFQQLGPPASTFSAYQTAVWQLVDTIVYTRGRHALKGRRRSPLVPAQHHRPTQPHRLLRLHHHRHRPAGSYRQRQRYRQLPARPGRHLPDRPPDFQAPPPRPHPGVLRRRRLACQRQPDLSISEHVGPSTSRPPRRTTRAPCSISAPSSSTI